MAELLVKLRFTEEAAKYIIVIGLDSGEELDHLDDNMGNSLSQNCRKPGADQNIVVVSTMAQLFLKLLVWGLQHMKRVSKTI